MVRQGYFRADSRMARFVTALFALCALSVIAADEVIKAVTAASDVKDEVDKVIEDEITTRLSNDLLQSIEKKFLVDLEKSVNMVLVKIRLLLRNGTAHVQDRLLELQAQLDDIRKAKGTEMEICLEGRQNETRALAEKTLHQMVVCGYALIGHDPAQAISAVISMKEMIKTRLEPIHSEKTEVFNLLKHCGHEHDSLKKVIKCVIAKSPMIKSAMMDVTSRLIQGVVDLTKLMAHGAMHEACLIEVIKTVEDEAFEVVRKVRNCAFGNVTEETSATENDLEDNTEASVTEENREIKIDGSKKEVGEMKDLLRRMLDGKGVEMDKKFKKKLERLQKDLSSVDTNAITNDVKLIDK